jgi:hypothetical protein
MMSISMHEPQFVTVGWMPTRSVLMRPLFKIRARRDASADVTMLRREDADESGAAIARADDAQTSAIAGTQFGGDPAL